MRNILLIGTTGSGKSTLANVLMGENRFRESSRSISITKNVEEGTFEVEIDKEGKEKIKYRVIDTIGIGDTKMKPQGVLMRLAEMADRVKQEGLNQILFVIKSRFTKEEIEAYDLLSSIIFEKEVINYTTIVRTGFEEFEDKEACDDDRGLLRTENAELAQLRAVDIIYLDNPPLKGRNAESNKLIREESRKRILTYLGGCRKTYRPKNIDTLDERVQDYKTNEEKLKEKMKELEKARKEQETEFRKKLTELKEDQVRELRENRKKFEEDLNKVKTEGEENLRKTVNEMEDKQKKQLDEHEQRNKEREKENNARHEKDLEKLEKTIEEQKREQKEGLEKNREELKRLTEEELKIRKEEIKREQDRKDKLAEVDINLKNQQLEAEKTKAYQEEKAQKLQQEKKAAGILETV